MSRPLDCAIENNLIGYVISSSKGTINMDIKDIKPLEYGKKRLLSAMTAFNKNDLYKYDIQFESAYDHNDKLYEYEIHYKNENLLDVLFIESLSYSFWVFTEEKYKDAPDTVLTYRGLNTIPAPDADPHINQQCFITFYTQDRKVQISYSFTHVGDDFEDKLFSSEKKAELISDMRRFGEELFELPKVQDVIKNAPEDYTVEFHYNPEDTDCIAVSFMNPDYISHSLEPLAWINRGEREKEYGSYQYVECKDKSFELVGLLGLSYASLVPNEKAFEEPIIENDWEGNEISRIEVDLMSTSDVNKIIETHRGTDKRII